MLPTVLISHSLVFKTNLLIRHCHHVEYRERYNPFDEEPVEKRSQLLYDFASWNHRSKLEKLLELEVDIDYVGLNGNTALHQALENGHTECARLLVSKAADVNTRDTRRCTPLWISVEADNPVAVEFLLQDGANKEAKVEDRTPLMEASMRCHLKSLKVLLKSKANVDATDTIGKTALMLAAEAGHCRPVQELLTYGASTDVKTQTGRTAHDFATANGYDAVAELLEEFDRSIPGADRSKQRSVINKEHLITDKSSA